MPLAPHARALLPRHRRAASRAPAELGKLGAAQAPERTTGLPVVICLRSSQFGGSLSSGWRLQSQGLSLPQLASGLRSLAGSQALAVGCAPPSLHGQGVSMDALAG